MSIWIIIASLLFTLLAIKRLDWALLIIIAGLPSYLIRFSIFGVPTTWLEIMILIVTATFIIKRGINAKKEGKSIYLKTPFTIESVLIIVIALIAAGTAGFNLHSLSIWKAYFVEPVILFFLIINVLSSKRDQTKILWSLAVSALAVSALAVFQKITGLFIANHFWEVSSNRRAVSFFGYPNAVGLFLGPLSLLLIGWAASLSWKTATNKIWSRTIIIITVILSILGIYSARSEGALAAIMVSLAIMGIMSGGKKLLGVAGILAVLLVGAFYFAPNHSYLINKVGFHDLSGQIRLQQWKETWDMLKDGKLITGAGLDNYQKAVAPFHQDGIFYNYDNLPDFNSRLYGSAVLRAKYWQPVEIYMYPHDIFLNFWSELGLAGLILFIWIIAKFLTLAIKAYKKYKIHNDRKQYLILGLIGVMTAIIVHGLVDVPYFKNDLSAMFWIFIALLTLVIKEQKKYENDPAKSNIH